jgi:hypothetical protein
MFWVYRGNGDSIKHAYQLIQALLKNSETELMNLLPSSNKSRSTTITSNHESEGEMSKTQRTNTGPRLQNNGKDNFSCFYIDIDIRTNMSVISSNCSLLILLILSTNEEVFPLLITLAML